MKLSLSYDRKLVSLNLVNSKKDNQIQVQAWYASLCTLGDMAKKDGWRSSKPTRRELGGRAADPEPARAPVGGKPEKLEAAELLEYLRRNAGDIRLNIFTQQIEIDNAVIEGVDRFYLKLAEQGYKEVVLLGQTVNSYVHEDVDFAALLRTVAEIDGIERIRFTSPYPVDFSPRVIEVIATEPKICPQVHLPLQSGSDVMLEQMRRGYSRQQFLDLVGALREAVPSIALSTDIMVGFCGETDRDHQQTLEVMREVRFDFAFMFSYSDRGITYASRKMTDDVPAEVKGARLRDVIDLQETHTRASHDAWVGNSLDVLVLGPSKRGDKTLGRAPTFHKVLLPPDAGARGSFVRARITGSTGHSLLADLG